MITIVDYGVGNIGSIQNMLKKFGFPSTIASNLNEIKNAKKIILPGVGKFDYAMKQLTSRGIDEVLNQKVIVEKTPILGICLGVQLFTEGSEEGLLPGLGWFDATTIKFNIPSSSKYKTPNMGWQNVLVKKQSKLLTNIEIDARFYFVHSYHLKCNNQADVILEANYSYSYPCAIEKENIVGVQFHPEKSHKFGMKILKNFVELY